MLLRHATCRRVWSIGTAVALLSGATAADIARSCDRAEQVRSDLRADAGSTAPVGPIDRSAAPADRRVWAETYALAVRRADAGSAEASRLALDMHRHGPIVYGMKFDASEQQLRRWQRQIECDDCPCATRG